MRGILAENRSFSRPWGDSFEASTLTKEPNEISKGRPERRGSGLPFDCDIMSAFVSLYSPILGPLRGRSNPRPPDDQAVLGRMAVRYPQRDSRFLGPTALHALPGSENSFDLPYGKWHRREESGGDIFGRCSPESPA